MDIEKSFVYLSADRYEEMVSRSTEFFIIEKAYKGMKSYQFEEFLKSLFGAKEDGEC